MNENHNPPKKRKFAGYAILVMLVCIGVLLFPYIKEYTSVTSKGGEAVVITVPQGASVSTVARMLEDKGLLKSRYTFLLKYKLNPDTYKSIYSGEFVFHKGMSLKDMLTKLTTEYDTKATVSLMVPEGFSIEMIALRCRNLGLCTVEEFISEADSGSFDYEFLSYIPNAGYRHRLEGFLFPSTYEVYADATAHDIIDKMLSAFETEYLKEFSSYDNLFDNVIIASMIEREAAAEGERAAISGVIKNRLAVPMRLQLDATAVYAKTNGYYDIETPSAQDVQFDSPYNTYICDALPPGPICCPGIKSILAAAKPENHNYLYYHTDTTKNDGSHVFTETYDEHMAGL